MEWKQVKRKNKKKKKKQARRDAVEAEAAKKEGNDKASFALSPLTEEGQALKRDSTSHSENPRSMQQAIVSADPLSSTESPTIDSSLVVEDSSEDICNSSANEESSDDDLPTNAKSGVKKPPLHRNANLQDKFLQRLDQNPLPRGSIKASTASKTSKRR